LIYDWIITEVICLSFCHNTWRKRALHSEKCEISEKMLKDTTLYPWRKVYFKLNFFCSQWKSDVHNCAITFPCVTHIAVKYEQTPSCSFFASAMRLKKSFSVQHVFFQRWCFQFISIIVLRALCDLMYRSWLPIQTKTMI
jgi:hypothetical protein